MSRKTSAGMVDLKKFQMFPGVMLLITVGMARNLAVSCDLIQWIMRAPDDPMDIWWMSKRSVLQVNCLSARGCENKQQRVMDRV